MNVGLRVDVDTYRGMAEGVPSLLKAFRRHGVKGTFFLSFGPDRAGQAIWNVFREKGFLAKMIRTRAWKLYGVRTILSGLLLPARHIADACPDLVRRIRDEGHEVGLHAWDHRRWQDAIDRMSEDEIRAHFRQACESFRRILGTDPRSAAAPSWKVSARSLEIEDTLGLAYASDIRFDRFCRLRSGEKTFSLLQVPASSRCLEELISAGVTDMNAVIESICSDLRGAGCPVITVHAEVEGGSYSDYLDQLLDTVAKAVGTLVPLETLASQAKNPVPVCELCRAPVPGRAGLMSSARQGAPA